ncbi:MAG: cell division protein SepF [Mollicutes bacterium]|nr:MAG: cell division protein SepF [Mollicutes bacterium]
MEDAQKITLNSYDEVQYATKILLEHKKIIVILSNIQKTERRRIIDFLSGVVFVNQGKIISAGPNQYLFVVK